VKALPTLIILALLATTARSAPDRTREVRLAAKTPWETVAVVRKGPRKGPVVVIVGGVHGNEAAGWRAARQIRHWPIVRGTLVIIPRANRAGIEKFRRTVPEGKGYDLNRQFPSKKGTPVKGALAKPIWDLVSKLEPDWLIDLHESVDYRYRSTEERKHLGNTLIAYPSDEALRVAGLMRDAASTIVTAKAKR